METSGECGVECAAMRCYPLGNSVPFLTSQQQVSQEHVVCLAGLKINGLSLDDPLMYRGTQSDRVLGRIDIQGTPEVEIMMHAGINTYVEDQFEYDINIPLPPPNRRYKVKLNIKTIKKGKPTIVDTDWA
jgi:hypothetical protein